VSSSGDSRAFALLSRAEGRNPVSVLQEGFVAFIIGVFANVIGVVDAFFGIYESVLTAIGDAASLNVFAFLGGVGRIVSAGVESTVNSILPGAAFDLGPLSFALGIASVGVGLYVAGIFLNQATTGDTVLGVPFDIPGLGTDEEGEE
jgi:hypothetical protein